MGTIPCYTQKGILLIVIDCALIFPVWGKIEESGIFCPRIPGRMGYGMLWVGFS